MRKAKNNLRVSNKQKTTYRKIILSISLVAIAGACFFMFNNLGVSENAKANLGNDHDANTQLPPSPISDDNSVNGIHSSADTTFIPNGTSLETSEPKFSSPLSNSQNRAGNSPLPVVLKSFDVENKNETAFLFWETASEINNDYFIIERSWDGISFEYLGQVKGYGTTTVPHKYSFTDDVPYLETSFYRLTQVDFTGEKEIYAPRSFTYSLMGTEMKLVQFGPNPFIDEISLLLQFSQNTQLRAELYTVAGQKIWQTIQEVPAGRASYTLNPAVRASGIYHLRLSNTEGKNLLVKLVKQ